MIRRTWFITGVNSGFGRQMTEQLLGRGDRVAGAVRKMDAMNNLKDQYGDLLWLAHLDMTDTAGIRQVVNKVFADLGKIEVIVNNAGYGLFGAAALPGGSLYHARNDPPGIAAEDKDTSRIINGGVNTTCIHQPTPHLTPLNLLASVCW